MRVIGSRTIPFECGRCGRIREGSAMNPTIQCVCHTDCDYCGLEETCTTAITTATNQTFKHENDPTTLRPDRLNETYGPCSSCGYYNVKAPVDMTPQRVEDMSFEES